MLATCSQCQDQQEAPAAMFAGLCDACGGQSLSTPPATRRTPPIAEVAQWAAAQHHDPASGRRWTTYQFEGRDYTRGGAIHFFGYDPDVEAQWVGFLRRVCEAGGVDSSSAYALGGRYPHPNHSSLPTGVVPSSSDDGNRGGHGRGHLAVDSRPGFTDADGASFRGVILTFRLPIQTGELISSPPRDWSQEDAWRADLAALARHGVSFNSSPAHEVAWAKAARETRRPVLG